MPDSCHGTHAFSPSKCTAVNQLKGSSVPGYSLDVLMICVDSNMSQTASVSTVIHMQKSSLDVRAESFY